MYIWMFAYFFIKCNQYLVLITTFNTFGIMGRKSTEHSTEMYALAKYTVEGMVIGEVRIIGLPDDIAFFRKYLSEIGKRTDCKYTTKYINGQLHVMRIKYSNIYSSVSIDNACLSLSSNNINTEGPIASPNLYDK